MIVVDLAGGLGNQMFQYAFGRHLSHKYNVPVFLSKSIYNNHLSNRTFDLDIFRLNPQVVSDYSALRPFARKEVLCMTEEQFHFDINALDPLDDVDPLPNPLIIISGYWQSEKYFKPIEPIIRSEFTFMNGLSGKWLDLYHHITSIDAVMINVRRGDYLNSLDYHGVVSLEYLYEGIDRCRKSIRKPYFFVFSDDMDWCRKNLKDLPDLFFVGEEYYDNKFQSYLQLMIACKHFIVSNSSFAWWAAWLCPSTEKIVFAPKRWFTTNTLDTRDLLPESWITL